jgi:Icc-related predicted phosphoesterase
MRGSELRILAVSDEVDQRLYGPGEVLRGRPVPDLLLGCGDLPPYYLDYLVSKLDVPLYAVHGNHDVPPSQFGGQEYDACGASWLGGRVQRVGGLLLAGLDGSLRYNGGAYQSSQAEMFGAARRLVPRLLLNKARYGRYLDVLVTHAPPAGIHDQDDRCHQGFEAFNWLIRHFRPRYHVHGHIHLFDPRTPTVTRVGTTDVVNVYPFRELSLSLPPPAS